MCDLLLLTYHIPLLMCRTPCYAHQDGIWYVMRGAYTMMGYIISTGVHGNPEEVYDTQWEYIANRGHVPHQEDCRTHQGDFDWSKQVKGSCGGVYDTLGRLYGTRRKGYMERYIRRSIRRICRIRMRGMAHLRGWFLENEKYTEMSKSNTTEYNRFVRKIRYLD